MPAQIFFCICFLCREGYFDIHVGFFIDSVEWDSRETQMYISVFLI